MEVCFEVFGAPSALAAAGWLAERARGATVAEARSVRGLDICRSLALETERAGEALVAEDALAAALKGANETDEKFPEVDRP